ncbi:hypothetical protein CsSME_00043514 [Camellia sinensis var. sinensis]
MIKFKFNCIYIYFLLYVRKINGDGIMCPSWL